MAIDPQLTQSETFRDTLVTDIEWVFDYGVTDAVTLHEGDTIDWETEPGWLVILLKPRVPGGFPETIRHPVNKIIGERHQMRVMKVKIDRPTEVAGAASVAPPVDPTLAHSGASTTGDTVSPASPEVTTPPAPPAPRGRAPRRKTPRPVREPD